MAEFYYIKIGSFWLTVDGADYAAAIGKRCELKVDGIPGLRTKYRKATFRDFRGNAIVQKTEVGTAGRPIVINVLGKLPAATARLIEAANEAALDNETVIRLQGTESPASPDFDHDVLPDGDEAFTWESEDAFGNYKGAVLRYVTAGQTLLTWGGVPLYWPGGTVRLAWSRS